MQEQENQNTKMIEVIGKYAAYLSLIEVALGSVLHAVRVPFAGNFLSLNQGFLLCRACLESKSKKVPYAISNVSAVLKSLAPAGKKLGPMLSLSAQGMLFSLGIFLLGINLPGLCLGMALLSLWTFLQPLITYYLFFGSELWRAIEYLYEKSLPYHGLSEKNLFRILLFVISLKIFLAVVLAVLATRGKWANLQDKIFELAKEKGAKPVAEANGRTSPVLLAIRDLFHPLFIFSFIATFIFLYFSEHSYARWVFILLRPLAIGFIFFYISRTVDLNKWLHKLHGSRWEGFAKSCEIALAELRSNKKNLR